MHNLTWLCVIMSWCTVRKNKQLFSKVQFTYI